MFGACGCTLLGDTYMVWYTIYFTGFFWRVAVSIMTHLCESSTRSVVIDMRLVHYIYVTSGRTGTKQKRRLGTYTDTVRRKLYSRGISERISESTCSSMINRRGRHQCRLLRVLMVQHGGESHRSSRSQFVLRRHICGDTDVER